MPAVELGPSKVSGMLALEQHMLTCAHSAWNFPVAGWDGPCALVSKMSRQHANTGMLRAWAKQTCWQALWRLLTVISAKPVIVPCSCS